jgi:hypothetical protein
MEDGGMGSLLIQPGSSITEFGVSEKYFHDSDGVLVTAKLNTTREGKPAEIDIWKVDFSKLKSWPTTNELSDNPPNKRLWCQPDLTPF